MISLKDVGLIIRADGREIPVINTRDGHYGPVYATIKGSTPAPFGPQSRGLDPRLAVDAH